MGMKWTDEMCKLRFWRLSLHTSDELHKKKLSIRSAVRWCGFVACDARSFNGAPVRHSQVHGTEVFSDHKLRTYRSLCGALFSRSLLRFSNRDVVSQASLRPAVWRPKMPCMSASTLFIAHGHMAHHGTLKREDITLRPRYCKRERRSAAEVPCHMKPRCDPLCAY